MFKIFIDGESFKNKEHEKVKNCPYELAYCYMDKVEEDSFPDQEWTILNKDKMLPYLGKRDWITVDEDAKLKEEYFTVARDGEKYVLCYKLRKDLPAKKEEVIKEVVKEKKKVKKTKKEKK